MLSGNVIGYVHLSNALTFESLDKDVQFLLCRFIYGMIGSDAYIEVITLRSRSQEQ